MHNSRLLLMQQSVRFFGSMVFWTPVTIFSLLLIYNTLSYFSFSRDFSFILERQLLFEDGMYYTFFYVHIAAGVICIAASLVQFSSYILKRRKTIHVWSGKFYVLVVLLAGAPTGLYMAFFAKGSFYERALFLFMALFWFFTTWKGWSVIRKKQVLAHKIWMIRSYSMAMTAVTFRIYHLVFYMLGWDHLENYELSLWISVIGNMLVAESVIWRKSKSYLKSFVS
ncbi:MAG TPA: DUF2306 domain-containing protein [Flavisolibacter sp.]